MTEPMDIDDFQSTTDKFLTWLKNNGATISPSIQVADLRDRAAGRGVVATQDLPEDAELFSIPRTSILTNETSDLPATIRKELDHPWLSLILVMVYEYLKASHSPWQPYFNILPENFDSLMYWSDEELQYLEGSAVVDKIGKEAANSTFSDQIIPIIARHADVFQTGGRSNEELLSLCHRMGSTIMAYAFDLEKPEQAKKEEQEQEQEEWEEDEESATLPKGMVPLADLLNADADRNNTKLFYEDDKVVIMKTIKPVKAGEELYNDFGPLPRADLLRRYGYVTEQYAKYDLVEISADMIKEQSRVQLKLSDKTIEERWSYAEEQGVGDDAYDIARVGSEDGQFPEEFCVLLNLLATSKPDFEKMKKKEKLPKTDLTVEAKKLLRAILVHRYAAYPSLSAPAGGSTPRFAMAEQVINGEKQVLQEAVDAITDANVNKKRSADTLEDEANAIRQPMKR